MIKDEILAENSEKMNIPAHNLMTDFPEIASEWDYEKNAPAVPSDFGHGSTKKAWWICEKGHSYYARIDHRTIMHSGCPYCHNKKALKGENDLATVFPDLASEWDFEHNEKEPSDYLPKSNVSVFWLCPYCGFSYSKRINDRVSKHSGCPQCTKERGTSFQEQSLYYYLSRVTEVKNRFRDFGTEIDLYLPAFNTGIEYNGKYYHRNRKTKDDAKFAKIRNRGIRLITVNEDSGNEIIGDSVSVKASESGHVDTRDLEWTVRTVFKVIGLEEPEVNIEKDHIRIKEQYIISEKEDKFAARYPAIAAQWDYAMNGRLKPESFQYASNHSAYWKCDACGGSYKAQISNRTIGGQGCPYCAGKKVKIGFNDLASQYPEIASQWSMRNGDKRPEQFVAGSEKKAWWICDKCNNEWECCISSRTQLNTGCPVCAGRMVVKGYNDLQTTHPEIAAEWHPEKNGNLKPSDLVAGSNKNVWWKCGTCGHEWRTNPAARMRGRGCPVCNKLKAVENAQKTKLSKSVSLAAKNPIIASEWDYDKNGTLRPENVMAGSDFKVWWKCANCGNNWQAAISARTGAGSGCPECGKKKSAVSRRRNILASRGSLAVKYPELVKEWNYDKNGTLTPNDVTPGSKKRVWWKCKNGHEWQAVIYSRKNCGCPVCAGKKPRIPDDFSNKEEQPL